MHELNDDGRVDLYVYNEATAWTMSSRALVETDPLDDEDPDAWSRAFGAGVLIAQELVQDDTFHVRVALGDLTPEEEQSWVGRTRWWLQVPDGELVIAAGGEFSWGWAEDLEDDEFIQSVAVPAGDYEVTILTTYHGVNGEWILDHEHGERDAAAWWRESRPGEDLPDWLKLWILNGNATDPGHEDEWEWPFERYERLARKVEAQPSLDWIVQLRPLTEEPTDRPTLEDGMVAAQEVRLPAVVPAAVVCTPVNAEEVEQPGRPEPADVLERLGDVDAIEVEGGPVALPATDAFLLGRLGWFANPDVDVEVLVDGEVGDWVEQHIDADVVAIRTAPDGRLRLSFPPASTVHDVEAELKWHADAFAALPNGARLDVVTAAEGTPAGRMGFSSTARDGALEVWGSFPAVDADELADALALAREAEGGSVSARSEPEIDAVRERWRAEGLQRVTPLIVDGTELGHDEGDRFTLRVGAALFAVRFGQTWECVEPEDPLGDLGLDLEDEFLTFDDWDGWPLGRVLHEDDESGRRFLDVDGEDLAPSVVALTEPSLEAFEDAGAARVGDLVCDMSANILVRGVAEKQARWYGVLMVAPYVDPVTEVYSTFADGSSITTTTNPFAGLGGPEKGIYRNMLPAGTSVAELVHAHIEAIARHASQHGTEVVLIRQNLVGLAIALEEFLSRQFS